MDCVASLVDSERYVFSGARGAAITAVFTQVQDHGVPTSALW